MFDLRSMRYVLVAAKQVVVIALFDFEVVVDLDSQIVAVVVRLNQTEFESAAIAFAVESFGSVDSVAEIIKLKFKLIVEKNGNIFLV